MDFTAPEVYDSRPMPDKPHAWFALPGHHLVTLEGRDALAFSHAQFMSDVKSLAPGNWQWSGWLTPKGRVIALFALLRREDDAVWLVLPDAAPDAFVDALRRYVFRSKVVIEVARGTPIAACAAPTGEDVATCRSGASRDGLTLDMSGEGASRQLRIGGDPAPEDPAALQAWTETDLRHGLPRLPPDQAGHWTPQQLSLERLQAFSVKKGCYPGQEIVARTHFLGQAKRGLVLLEGDGPVGVGAQVAADGKAIGTVVSAAGRLALAVLPLARDGVAMDAWGVVVREQPLLGGLAR